MGKPEEKKTLDEKEEKRREKIRLVFLLTLSISCSLLLVDLPSNE